MFPLVAMRPTIEVLAEAESGRGASPSARPREARSPAAPRHTRDGAPPLADPQNSRRTVPTPATLPAGARRRCPTPAQRRAAEPPSKAHRRCLRNRSHQSAADRLTERPPRWRSVRSLRDEPARGHALVGERRLHRRLAASPGEARPHRQVGHFGDAARHGGGGSRGDRAGDQELPPAGGRWPRCRGCPEALRTRDLRIFGGLSSSGNGRRRGVLDFRRARLDWPAHLRLGLLVPDLGVHHRAERGEELPRPAPRPSARPRRLAGWVDLGGHRGAGAAPIPPST